MVAAVIVAIAVVSVLALRGCTTNQPTAQDEKPASEASQGGTSQTDAQGNQDTKDVADPKEWIEWLDSEQKAELEIAYDASVAEGYEGSLDEWVTTEVQTRLNGNGNIVVTLPDGGEFTVIAPSSTEGDQNTSGPDEPEADPANEGAQSEESAPGEQSALISVDTVVAHKGDKRVALPIKILGNPGVLGLTFSVSYDESAVTLVGAENGKAFEGTLALTRSRTFASGCLFTWDGVDIKPEQVKDGTVLTLFFDVADNATGLHSVAVRGTSAFDADLNSVSLTTQDGSIVIE